MAAIELDPTKGRELVLEESAVDLIQLAEMFVSGGLGSREFVG